MATIKQLQREAAAADRELIAAQRMLQANLDELGMDPMVLTEKQMDYRLRLYAELENAHDYADQTYDAWKRAVDHTATEGCLGTPDCRCEGHCEG